MSFKQTITKEEINTLPVATYLGKVMVIDSLDLMEKAIKRLSRKKIVGFDTETRPSFKKGVVNTLSLVQVAGENEVYLFRLKKIGDAGLLWDFLANDSVLKIGLSVKDDLHMISRLSQISKDSFVELQQYVKQFGIEDNSLQKIYAIVFQEKIVKSQRLSNWDADILTDKQLAYAAIDAWSCLRLWTKLEKKRKNKPVGSKKPAKKPVCGE